MINVQNTFGKVSMQDKGDRLAPQVLRVSGSVWVSRQPDSLCLNSIPTGITDGITTPNKHKKSASATKRPFLNILLPDSLSLFRPSSTRKESLSSGTE